MNPHQKNKIDVNSMTPEEQKLFRLYGKVPNRNDLLQNKLKERKYFDSGDYALSKAGKASDVGVTSIGSQHPLPENIPHLSSPGLPTNSNGGNGLLGNMQQQVGAQGGSPVKERSILHRETSVDDQDNATEHVPQQASISPPRVQKAIPVRWQS